MTGTPADPAWPARLLDALRLLREHISTDGDADVVAAARDAVPPDHGARMCGNFGLAADYSDTRRSR